MSRCGLSSSSIARKRKFPEEPSALPPVEAPVPEKRRNCLTDLCFGNIQLTNMSLSDDNTLYVLPGGGQLDANFMNLSQDEGAWLRNANLKIQGGEVSTCCTYV